MNSYKNEKLLRQIAKEYIKKSGEELDIQSDMLNSENHHMPDLPSPLKKKSYRWIPWVSVAAACATIIFVVLNLSIISNFLNNGFLPDTTDKPLATIAPSNKLPEIKLSSLRFNIDKMEEDNGHVIYTINDKYGDDAVAHLMPADDFDSTGMQQQGTVYYKNKSGYKVMAVKNGDWVICLSCTYEMQTLNSLYSEMKIIL